MTATVFAASILLAAIVTPTNGYGSFRDLIPNGYMVPHPCYDDMMWNGVGHQNYMGSGTLNPFGEEFKAGGYWWNTTTCWRDSDGDGKTNGEELGDPNCMWYQGGPAPERSYDITHPGVCEPVDSGQCKSANMWLQCEEKYECPQINATGVTRFPMPLDEVEIPARDMSTFCKTINIPTDQDYYVIATETIIGNMDFVGSIVVYGCPDDDAPQIDSTRECMSEDTEVCASIMGFWTYGASDMCFGDQGFRVGQSSTKRVLVKVTYYNEDKIAGKMDTSGMAVYVKSAPSDTSMDLRTLMFGTTLMEIPPGENSYEVESVCKGTCTGAMVMSPAKIWGARNVMGALGAAMRIEVFRGGMKVADVTWDDPIDMMKPTLHTHEPHLDLYAGDEIKTTCEFRTQYTDKFTRGGEEMGQEMCLGLVMAYPYSAFSFEPCLTFGDLDICDLYAGTPMQTSTGGQCSWYDFTRSSDDYTPMWITDVANYCSEDGVCRDMCMDTVKRWVENEPCLSKEAALLVNWRLDEEGTGHRAMAALNTCRGVMHSDDDDDDKDTCTWDDCYQYCDDSPYDAAPSLIASSIVMTVSLGFALFFKA